MKEEDFNDRSILNTIPRCMGHVTECEIFQRLVERFDAPSAIYDYYSLDHPELYAMFVARWDKGGEKTFRPFCAEGDPSSDLYQWTLAGIPERRPPFNWTELLDPSKRDWPVMIVEGEKTCLEVSGFFPNHIVITSSGGSNSPSKTHWPVEGRDVVIACDYDFPGKKYGDEVARLARLGGARSVSIFRWSTFLEKMCRNDEITSRNGAIPKGYDLGDLIVREKWSYHDMVTASLESGGLFGAYPFPPEETEDELEDSLEFETPPVRPYRKVTAGEMMLSPIPDRQYLLGSWLTTKSSNMIFAPRGVGKSFLALNIGLGVATGKTCLTWRSHGRHEVIYVDGEMPDIAWKERLTDLGFDPTTAYINNLSFITHDSLIEEEGRRVPDLGREEDRLRIEASLTARTKLLILDNISTLTTGVDENDGLAWEPIAEWVEKLKHTYGLAVLFIHHAGKSGKQRGISKREDAMDTVISLARPSDYDPSQMARFDIEFTKGRTVSSSESAGLQVHLKEGVWKTVLMDTVKQSVLCELYTAGAPIHEIREALGVGLQPLYQMIEEAAQMGMIRKRSPKKSF